MVVNVHFTDQTLIDQHGVVRTEHGPITLDQFRQWLTQADPAALTIRPVLDPAATAAVDAYEIPLSVRQAITVRHPGSVWPFSPATTVTARRPDRPGPHAPVREGRAHRVKRHRPTWAR